MEGVQKIAMRIIMVDQQAPINIRQTAISLEKRPRCTHMTHTSKLGLSTAHVFSCAVQFIRPNSIPRKRLEFFYYFGYVKPSYLILGPMKVSSWVCERHDLALSRVANFSSFLTLKQIDNRTNGHNIHHVCSQLTTSGYNKKEKNKIVG
jgi:hypothetical protein